MKILYIANSRIPTEKAHGLQIMKMCEAFLLEGHDVTLLLPRRKNPIKNSPAEYYSLKDVPKIIYTPNCFGFLEKYFHRTYFFFQRVCFGKLAFFYTWWSKVDIIFSREITICFFLSILGKKVVFEDHEPKKRMRFLYKFFVKHIWKKVIVPPALVHTYEACGVAKNTYIVAPNGVDLSQFYNLLPDRNIWKKYNIDLHQKIALYIGHFYAWKGVYTLIDSSAFIQNVQIVLIGGTEIDRVKVEEYVNKKNIKNVHIIPFMSHSEVLKCMVSADVLVLPNTAKEERSNMYTTPIKLFEYMASGVPIVASDVPSFHNFLNDEETAYLFKPDDSRELSLKINKALNENRAHEIAISAKKEVLRYDLRSRAKSIINFVI